MRVRHTERAGGCVAYLAGKLTRSLVDGPGRVGGLVAQLRKHPDEQALVLVVLVAEPRRVVERLAPERDGDGEDVAEMELAAAVVVFGVSDHLGRFDGRRRDVLHHRLSAIGADVGGLVELSPAAGALPGVRPVLHLPGFDLGLLARAVLLLVCHPRRINERSGIFVQLQRQLHVAHFHVPLGAQDVGRGVSLARQTQHVLVVGIVRDRLDVRQARAQHRDELATVAAENVDDVIVSVAVLVAVARDRRADRAVVDQAAFGELRRYVLDPAPIEVGLLRLTQGPYTLGLCVRRDVLTDDALDLGAQHL